MTNPAHPQHEESDSAQNIPQNSTTAQMPPTNNFRGYNYNFVGDYPVYELANNYVQNPGYPPYYYPPHVITSPQINPEVETSNLDYYYIPADVHYNFNAQSKYGYAYPGYAFPSVQGMYADNSTTNPFFAPVDPTSFKPQEIPFPPAFSFPMSQVQNVELSGTPPLAQEKIFSKKTWRILGGMSAAVIIVLGCILIPPMVRSYSINRESEQEQQVVENYFLALSNGDAPKALALSHSKPTNIDFLSSDILQQQISQSAITDVQVEKPTDPSSGLVKYSIAINGKIIHDEIKVSKQADGSFQLDKGYITLSINNKDHRQGLTLFGKEVKDTNNIAVFPGVLDFGSLSGFVHFSVADPQWLQAYNFDEISPTQKANIRLSLQPELTFLGRAQVMKLIISNIIYCSRADSLPKHCPVAFLQRGGEEKLRLSEPEYQETNSGKTSLGIIPFQVEIDYAYSDKGVDHTSHVTLTGVVNSLAHGTSLSLAWNE